LGRLLLIVPVLLLCLAAPLEAADGDNAVLEGRLVNGTSGGGSVPGTEVTVRVYLAEEETESVVTTTDSDGRFVFTGLSEGPDYTYVLEVIFEGVGYFARVASESAEREEPVEMVVYEPTTDISAVRVASAHTVVYREDDRLLVKEYALFVNESDCTYVGSEEVTSGEREVLWFDLPEEATETRVTLGIPMGAALLTGYGFTDVRPMLPGSREIGYSYAVFTDADAHVFTHECRYPTSEYSLLVEGELELGVAGLSAEGSIDMGGTVFTHFSGVDLPAGTMLSVRMAGLGDPGEVPVLVWVGVTLAVLAAMLGGLFLNRRRVSAGGQRSPGNQARRQRMLLGEIARLDDDFAGGSITADDYHAARAARKAELLELMRKGLGQGEHG